MVMRLNTIKPAEGSRKAATRVGRGIGCGMGKTCGRGHKGQRARAGGFHKVGFEGGQMPLQRRLPKFGFSSRKVLHASEVRLDELKKVKAKVIDLISLKAAGLINGTITKVKIIGSGKIEAPVHIVGIQVTRGARTAIEAVGGKIEE